MVSFTDNHLACELSTCEWVKHKPLVECEKQKNKQLCKMMPFLTTFFSNPHSAAHGLCPWLETTLPKIRCHKNAKKTNSSLDNNRVLPLWNL